MTASLQSLLSATNEHARELAWEAFLREHSGALLFAARALGGDHDAVMDRYLFVLDALRHDAFHRLRGYTATGSGKFTTWLIVVARRLGLDEHRHRYGRPQGDDVASAERHRERRNLTDLVGNELDLLSLEAPAGSLPDAATQRAEVHSALERALATLDTSDRLILRLRFEDGLSVPEIARLLGDATPFGLYRHLARVLASVRQHLETSGIHDATL